MSYIEDHRQMFETYKSVFVECAHIEHTRIAHKDKELFAGWYSFIVANIKLHTLLIDRNIDNQAETVFSNSSIRDFVLSVADRFYIEIGDPSPLLNALSNINHYSHAKDNTIPISVVNSLDYKTPDEVNKKLKSNSWLVVVIMLFLVYPTLVQQLQTDGKQKP